MKKLIALAIALSTLAGCAVYPAPYYGRPYAVYVAPHPYYYNHW